MNIDCTCKELESLSTFYFHFMKPVPNISSSVEGKPIRQVDRMVYLGYMATEDGKCDKDIKRRIGIARTAFESMAKILTSRNISIELRSRIAKCYIWSTLLYGA